MNDAIKNALAYRVRNPQVAPQAPKHRLSKRTRAEINAGAERVARCFLAKQFGSKEDQIAEDEPL
jgi:hypothetical protein